MSVSDSRCGAKVGVPRAGVRAIIDRNWAHKSCKQSEESGLTDRAQTFETRVSDRRKTGENKGGEG